MLLLSDFLFLFLTCDLTYHLIVNYLNDAAFIGSLITFGLGILFFGTLSTYLIQSFLGFYGVFILGLSTLICATLCFLLAYPLIIIKGTVVQVTVFKWFSLSPSLTVYFTLYIDTIAYAFALLTLMIALFVQTYAFAYFRYEPNIDRLLFFLNSFVVSMVILVLAGNLIVLFLGWELIGLTSFLLINFWSTRVGTLKAAFKAFTFNKISDFFVFLMIILGALTFQSFDIATILTSFSLVNELRYENLIEAGLLNLFVCALLGAAFIKSAQIGAHIWLPDSMEAPAPASALIHSATLVSAGIFLVLRFYPLCQHSWVFYYITPWIGVFTAWYGGMVAYFQNDLKRILAYSTISHCGFLMTLTTLGAIDYTLLYLYVHGFFKALAFLCVGNILRFSRGYQDIRRMGQFWKYLPFECASLILILLNLSGLPFFWGFYVKHLVVTGVALGPWMSWLLSCIFAAAITGFLYAFKIIFYVFFDSKKARKGTYDEVNLEKFNRSYYSNATLGAILSITFLLCVSYFILLFLFYQKIALSIPFWDSATVFLQNPSLMFTSTDKAALFNGAFLNWVIISLFTIFTLIKGDKNYTDLDAFNKFYILGFGLLFLSSVFYL